MMFLRHIQMYELWMTQGQGSFKVGEYETLLEASKRAKEGVDNNEGSFGIKMKDGTYYDWSKESNER